LGLKHQLKLQDRILIVKFLYQFLFEDIESFTIREIAVTLVKLFKNQDHLPTDALVLDWKPLYQLIRSFLKGKIRKIAGDVLKDLLIMTQHCNRFFSSDCHADILDTVLSEMNLLDPNRVVECFAWLNVLLPTQKQHAGLEWPNSLFGLWMQVRNVPMLDQIALHLFSRLWKDQYPALPESSEKLALMIQVGLKFLELPLGKGPHVSNIATSIHMSFYRHELVSLAQLVVYSITNDPKSLSHLKSIISAVEHFAHPSNSGSWSAKIAKLMQNIGSQLYERVSSERKQDCTVPQAKRLNSATIQAVCIQLSHISQSVMFNKDPSAYGEIRTLLKVISQLCPEILFDSLLPKIMDSLTSVNEPYRTKVAIDSLRNVGPQLVNSKLYPQGGVYLLPLLNLVLPAIDVNDPMKSISTFMFIAITLSNVPIVDSSSAEMDDFEEIQNELQSPGIVNREHWNATRLSTADFESWLLRFIDRIILLAENLSPNQTGGTLNPEENAMVEVASYACSVVFQQLSSPLEDVVLQKMQRFISNPIPQGCQLIGKICQFLGEKRLKALIPLCISAIEDELEQGASSRDISNTNNPFEMSKMSDTRFHWYQSILERILIHTGPKLLDFRSEVQRIIEIMLDQAQSTLGFDWAAKALTNTIRSMTQVYLLETKSLPLSQWNETFPSESFRRWSDNVDHTHLDAHWHYPNQKEIEFGTSLADHFVHKAIENLSRIRAAPINSNTGLQLRKWLHVLQEILVPIALFCEPDLQKQEEINDPMLKLFSTNRTKFLFNCGFLFRVGDKEYEKWTEILNHVRFVLLDMGDFLESTMPDDFDTIKKLLSTVSSHLAPVVDRYNDATRYGLMKSMFRIGKDKSLLPRSVKLLGVYSVYLKHIQHNLRNSTHSALVQKLFEMIWRFSISKYEVVRQSSFGVLNDIIENYRSYRALTFGFAIKTLQTNPSDEAILGCLEILGNKRWITGLFVYNWKYAFEYLQALLGLHHIERVPIVEKITRIIRSFEYFSCTNFRNVTSLTAKQLGQQLYALDSKTVQEMTAIDAERCSIFQKSYRSSMDLVLGLKDGQLNWRFLVFAIFALEKMLTIQAPIPNNLVTALIVWHQDNHPQIRDNAHKALRRIMIYLKHRATLQDKNNVRSIKKSAPGTSADTGFAPLTQSYDTAVFIDKSGVGCLYSPSTLRQYQGTILMGLYHDKDSDGAHEELLRSMRNKEFWLKAIEHREHSNETFYFVSDLYKHLFGLFQDDFLDLVLPTLVELVNKTDESNAQRTAAEFVGALLRGSKHWTDAKQQIIQHKVTPLLYQGIDTATSESIYHWLSCLRYVLTNRDPKRFGGMIQKLVHVSIPPDSSSFFSQSKHLLVISTVLGVCGSRVSSLVPGVLEMVIPLLSSPYQQVRECVANVVHQCLYCCVEVSFSSLKEFLNGDIVDSISMRPETKRIMNDITQKLTAVRWDKNVEDVTMAKTMFGWLAKSLSSHLSLPTSRYISLFFKLSLCIQQTADVDLNDLAVSTSRLIPSYFHTADLLSQQISLLSELCITDTESEMEIPWQVKSRALPALQVLFFRHVLLLTPALKKEVREYLLFLIQDPQLEVFRHNVGS
jgi:proteasome activator subunit 4